MTRFSSTLLCLLLPAVVSRVYGLSAPGEQSRLACTDETSDAGCLLNDDSFRFFVVGDFGGLPIWPYTTAAQLRVAGQMKQMATDERTQFQFALGDNFYLDGVKHVQDHRFKRTFEDVYADESLATPWYILAGNHDHRGNVSAQVEYTGHSDKWTMPGLYYSVRYRLPSGLSLEVLMLDTIVLAGSALMPDATYLQLLTGAADRTPPGPENREHADGQWQWIEQRLSQSKADYLLVMGHFPVYSVAEHGSTALLVDRLKPLLDQYNATAYIAGHEHTLQHIQEGEDGSGVTYMVSGMASRSAHSGAHASTVPAGWLRFEYPRPSHNPLGFLGFAESGFLVARLTEGGGTFGFYDKHAKLVHQANVTPRAKRVQ